MHLFLALKLGSFKILLGFPAVSLSLINLSEVQISTIDQRQGHLREGAKDFLTAIETVFILGLF